MVRWHGPLALAIPTRRGRLALTTGPQLFGAVSFSHAHPGLIRVGAGDHDTQTTQQHFDHVGPPFIVLRLQGQTGLEPAKACSQHLTALGSLAAPGTQRMSETDSENFLDVKIRNGVLTELNLAPPASKQDKGIFTSIGLFKGADL